MGDVRPELLITRGLPGSGKSTWALERIAKGHGPRRWVRVATGDLRVLLHGRETPWSRDREDITLGVRDMAIAATLRAGLNVIVDDCHLDPKSVAVLRDLGETEGAVVSERRFDVSLEEALWRNAHRQHPVPEHQILTLHRSYGKTRDDLRHAYRPLELTLPWAVVCDLDGTLAILTDRTYEQPECCANDRINGPVHQAIVGLYKHDGFARVLIVSGRPERARHATENWLKTYGLFSFTDREDGEVDIPITVILRRDGDERSEAVVKRELFDQHIAGKYNVVCVFDDRNRSVAMWRSLGLPTFQCADGDF